MSTFVITRYQERMLFGLWQDNRAAMLQWADPGDQILGNIYAGRVKMIVPGLDAAFVDIGLETDCFLSLREAKKIRLTTGELLDRPLKGQDEILVQVSREAVKSKPPEVTAAITLTGRLVVLMAGKYGIGVSARIHDETWRKEAKSALEGLLDARETGWIIRTDAYQEPIEEIAEDARALQADLEKVFKIAPYRSVPSCLHWMDSAWEKELLRIPASEAERIVTDIPEVYEEAREYLTAKRPELLPALSLYQGMPSLAAVYAVGAQLKEATDRKVYLKNGGYLVIEPTEALTVIDVNSGPMSGKRGNAEEFFRRINIEALYEACRQIRLRNLSGIILIDFVNLKSQAEREELFALLSRECAKDPVPTKAVDFTRLGLAEITRKKLYAPLKEQ